MSNGFIEPRLEDIKFLWAKGYYIWLEDKSTEYDGKLSISVVEEGKTLFCLPLSYGEGAYSGGTLAVSLSWKYLLHSYWTGIMMSGFALFKIDNLPDGLELIYAPEPADGYISFYCLSKDERLLVQVINRCGCWREMWEDGEFDEDDEGNDCFAFGDIFVHNIAEKTFTKHELLVYPSEKWLEENPWKQEDSAYSEDPDPPINPRLNGDILTMTMPWGDEIVTLPLEGAVKIKVT